MSSGARVFEVFVLFFDYLNKNNQMFHYFYLCESTVSKV